MEDTKMEPVTTSSSSTTATLLIKHLPEAIPHDTLFRLFSHYGAFSVRPCTSGRFRNCAFVDFNNFTLASQAQQQLNGLRFLGKLLVVERAGKPTGDDRVKKSDAGIGIDSSALGKVATPSVRDINEMSKSGAMPAIEPIAARLGVDYQFPPHLEYAYPPPDGNILTNIVNALIAVPRFYTQVLHLMNKMNIPAPFCMALPTPPLPPTAPVSLPTPPPPPIPSKPQLEDLSSDESELESSDEADDNTPGVTKPRRKRPKRESIVGPAIDKDVAHEFVGLKSATLVPKEIPMIKKKNHVLQIKIAPKVVQTEHRDDSNMEDTRELENEGSEIIPYVTPEELQSGKLPPEEILSLPMFKNYTVGNPASVLYIKNLSKEVTTDDMYFIFGSIFGSLDAAKSALSVKLMQEGRMRGQAFVTFPSVELAHQALSLVHGYVFKGKAMIIQFGRSPAAGKAF